MAKRGENIYQRKNGRWEGKYVRGRADGRIRYGYLTGSSYEEVLRRKQDKLREMEKNENCVSSKSLLLSDVSERWMKSRRGILKETTLGKYDSILKNYILPQYGDRRVDSLSEDEVRFWLEGLRLPDDPDACGISAKSVNGVASVLRLVLQYARTYFNILVPELMDVHIKQDKKQIEILSRSEQNLLEEYLLENMDPGNLGIMSSLYTGIRLGEVCALRWGSINQTDGLLDIHATMSRIKTKDPAQKTRIIITPPKSGCSVRQIPIPSCLLELMGLMRMPDECFFLTSNDKKYMDPRTLQNHFQSALKKCGIGPVKFHTLRHTFATRCVELGFDVKSLSEILGHASVTITMNRYVHPTIVMKKDYMDRLSLTHPGNGIR